MKLSQAKIKFIYACKLRGLSPKTITAYNDFIGMFITFAGDIEITDLDYEIVETYIEYLFSKPLSKATIATYLRHLKAFIHWLEESDYLEKKAIYRKIKLPKTPKKLVRIYSDEEIRYIFANISAKPDWIKSRNRLIVALMLDSGLRQNEVCIIWKKDIYLQDNLIKVHGKGDKERIVPIGRMVLKYLEKYLRECPYNSDMLFVSITGKVFTRNAIKIIMHKLEKVVGFEISSHKLRHNFATNYCLDQYDHYGQVDIYKLMLILGHEDMQTTRRYLHHANQIIISSMNISHLDSFMVPDFLKIQ